MKKITQLQEIKQYFHVPDEAIAFLENANVNTENGKYEFGPDCYVNVMVCDTVAELGHMEAHEVYVDVQVQIDGEERIYYADVAKLNLETPYNAEKDCAFYDYAEGSPYVDYTKGEAVILYPCDAHLPCRAIGKPMQVKKAVMKVRYQK